jgi:hypothetical protein
MRPITHNESLTKVLSSFDETLGIVLEELAKEAIETDLCKFDPIVTFGPGWCQIVSADHSKVDFDFVLYLDFRTLKIFDEDEVGNKSTICALLRSETWAVLEELFLSGL